MVATAHRLAPGGASANPTARAASYGCDKAGGAPSTSNITSSA
jgi:hypothetical protein